MSSAAYPDIKLSHTSISPVVSNGVNHYLNLFSRLHRILLELVDKVANIQNSAANELFAVAETFGKRVTDITKGQEHSPCESIVRFVSKYIEQIEVQGKCLQNLRDSFTECVIKPLDEAVEKKREVWRTCFHYADSFVDQIKKKEEDLQKRHKDYSEAAMKVKPGNRKDKQLQIFYDSHNTYLLRLSSVNSINNLLYTHVLPHTFHSIETSHTELNNQIRHQVRYMFTMQKEAWKKLIKSVDKADHLTDKIDLVADLRKYVKSINKTTKSKSPPVFKFTLPKIDPTKASLLDNVDARFVINNRTKPNLQRRLCSLQQQTEQLVDSIATMRSEEEEDQIVHSEDPVLNELIQFLCICDKEANLNVLLKQMELYTPRVLDFLGPMIDNLESEHRHSSKSPPGTTVVSPHTPSASERAHQFIEPLIMKPMSCFYCSKVSLIGKGFICKVCKISVHKKCATYVEFCQPLPVSSPSPPALLPGSTLDDAPHNVSTMECLGVYDLIDLESDEDGYYDEDEFDDGLSEEEEAYATPESQYATQSPLSPTRNISVVQEVSAVQLRNTSNPLAKNSVRRNTTLGIPLAEKPPVSKKPNLFDSGQPLVKVLPDLLTDGNMDSAPPTLPKPLVASSSVPAKPPPIAAKPTVASAKGAYLQSSKSFSPGSSGTSPKRILPKKPTLDHQNGKPSPVTPKPSIMGSKPTIKSEKSPTTKKTNGHVHQSNKPINHNNKSKEKQHMHATSVPTKPNETTHLSLSASQQIFCVSLYDYRGSEGTDLSFVSGCKIEVTQKTDVDWWYGNANGHEGYFPAQYVIEIGESDCVMRALFAFEKADEKELSVEEGDILVLRRYEEDWALVRSRDGEGLVPTSYMEQVGNQTFC